MSEAESDKPAESGCDDASTEDAFAEEQGLSAEELQRRRAAALRAQIEGLKKGTAEAPPANPRDFVERATREDEEPDGG